MKFIVNANHVTISGSLGHNPQLQTPIAAAMAEETLHSDLQLYLGKEILISAQNKPFKFDLNQMVDINASDEFGEVRARAQHADGINKYLVHYKSASGCVCTLWFEESLLSAAECDEHPGCPIYAAMTLPDGAKVEE